MRKVKKRILVQAEFLDTPTIETLKLLAKEAGAAILEIYGTNDFDVEIKADNSPLTRADQASNKIICAGLRTLRTQYPLISEENRDVPYAERRGYDTFWLVDPLDGTKEFIKRNGEFTVNIALIHRGRPVVGVVYAPVLDQLYWAADGLGAFLESNGTVSPLQVASFSMEDEGLGVVCSRSHLNDATQAFVDELNDPQTVSKGSSLKFLILASGKAHLYPRIAPTMEWDTGAAQCILEQAGGRVLEYETREPLRYNKESLLNPHFLATGKVV
ncbi:MAG: 3'(2'),5'-bisphosphate nucleotidase CysQ [Saprospiraceae bacterium]|nr:3'(2'),5'-bisphosphate nucleotidase CysQ [Saprospiraceae bacterium]